ncbi:MAG: DUF805 domain-containing protein [Ruminococcus sp.]|nr:DUF805 domain-containing protein [Ruminococcus sp.]
MKCINCGNEISDNAKFCNACGSAVPIGGGGVNLSKPGDSSIDRSINSSINMNTANTDGSPKYVNFGEAIQLYFKNYVNFSGRSTRSEYWYTVLFMFIIGFVLGLMGERVKALTTVWQLATFIPSLSICFRRFHDAGKNVTPLIIMYAAYFVLAILGVAAFGSAFAAGFGGSRSAANAAGGLVILFVLATIATLAVAIYNIVILCQPSVPTENQYGRSPMK